MGKRKIKQKKEIEGFQEWMYIFKTTGVQPKDGKYNPWTQFGPGEEDEDGRSYTKEILARWIKEHPGTRPWYWWNGRWEPKREPRRLLSGKLDPNASIYEYTDGLPSEQITIGEDGFLESWNKIDPRKEFYDPDDPPVYETQFQYLKRLKLLTPAEKKLLKSKKKQVA